MKKKKILLGLGAFALIGLATTTLASCEDNEKMYTVTFYDGGTEISATSVKTGYNVEVPATPTSDGKIFNGWYSDAELTTQFDFGSLITGDTSIYARWVNECTVTFKDGSTTLSTDTVTSGYNVEVPTAPTKEGFVFAGWYSDEALTKQFDFSSIITADTTIYANWVAEDAKIRMNGTAYETIAAALAAIPTKNDTNTYTITLPKGTYNENGLVYDGTATVKISGNTDTKYGADVIIKGHGADMKTEKGRNLISVRGTGNIILENLTLESDWTRAGAKAAGMESNTQAEVLGTDTKGNTVAYNCSFISHQDTIRTAGKAWFYGCHIEGDVDFLWMEAAGTVALYEKCEIVCVGDETTKSYVCAPRMTIGAKAGKGLVIYNSTVKEEETNADKLSTYLARSPWTSGYYSQVAYINTTCEGISTDIWYGTSIPNEFDETCVGFKMDQATATSLGYAGNNDIVDADTVSKEFNGRKTILNRIYNTGKLKYEKDSANLWDIDALIAANGWTVDADNSSETLSTDTAGESTVYKFDGSQDVASMVQGFSAHSSKSYAGSAGSTITIPVSGKCYVEVYGFYSGTVEVSADTQDGEAIMFFNNGSTSAEIGFTYAVYDAEAKSVVITAKATTYITKVIVTEDSAVTETEVSSIEVSANSKTECVGVGLTLSATVGAGSATNKSVKWSSSDTAIATIDEYTGKVAFIAAGEVTFTATACDGSGVTGTYVCNPIDPKWTQCEWYTTDQTVATEDGAEEIGNYDTGISAYKGLGSTFTLTNFAGETITTNCGLKLNSKGSLTIATTKSDATLTVIIAQIGLVDATPVVSDGTNTATLLSTTANEEAKTITYVYSLATAGAWTITRGDGSTECNPILYAKCVYNLTVSSNTFINYKGGTYHAESSDATAYNHNNDSSVKLDGTTATYDKITYTGAKSNGNDNWLKFNTGSTITFTTSKACTLKIYFYNGQNNATVTLDGTAVTTATSAEGANYNTGYAYTLSAGGEVVITAASNGYIGCFEVIFAA